MVVAAFARVGVDASSEEDTPDDVVSEKIMQWEASPVEQQSLVAQTLLQLNSHQIQQFIDQLSAAVLRQTISVRVLPLHGMSSEFTSLVAARAFVQEYHSAPMPYPFVKYEIELSFDNGNVIRGVFKDTESAVAFLSLHTPAPVQLATDDGEEAVTLFDALEDGK